MQLTKVVRALARAAAKPGDAGSAGNAVNVAVARNVGGVGKVTAVSRRSVVRKTARTR